MRVLVSVLGYYKAYREVTYEVTNDENETVSEQTRFSSVALKKAFNPDRTIVIVPFSLYHEAKKDLAGGKYSDLAKIVVDHFSSNNEAKPFAIGDFIVAPNIGRFTKDGKAFEYVEAGGKGRRLSLFQNYAFLKLYEALRGENDERVEILVDLTHGINYMQFLISDVVRTLAYSLLKDVKLRFFNSDPVNIPHDDPSVVVNVNEVMRENISPEEGFNSIAVELLMLDDKNLREALERYNKEKDRVRKLAKASFAGVFQIVGAYRGKIDELLNSMLGSIRAIDDREVKVNVEGNLTRLDYGSPLEPLTYKVVAALDAMYRATEGWSEEFSASWLKEKVEKYGNPVMKDLVENELGNINRRSKNIYEQYSVDGGWCRLDAVFKLSEEGSSTKEKDEKEGEAGGVNRRNLIAHGGLERNVTCMREANNELYFKYCAKKGLNVYELVLQQF